MEKAANEHQEEMFKLNPNGFTVAPYVNAETLADSFLSGVESLFTHLNNMAVKFDDASWFDGFTQLKESRTGSMAGPPEMDMMSFYDGVVYQFDQMKAQLAAKDLEIERLAQAYITSAENTGMDHVG